MANAYFTITKQYVLRGHPYTEIVQGTMSGGTGMGAHFRSRLVRPVAVSIATMSGGSGSAGGVAKAAALVTWSGGTGAASGNSTRDIFLFTTDSTNPAMKLSIVVQGEQF
jgi:hypothetical protein